VSVFGTENNREVAKYDLEDADLSVCQEDESVAVLNLLHRCFSGQRILNYIESVHPANKLNFAISVRSARPGRE
jgi:hypothetical protein